MSSGSDSSVDTGDVMGLQEWEPLSSYPKLRGPNDFTATMVTASRNSGKTYLIEHLFRKIWRKQYGLLVIFSNSWGVGEGLQFEETEELKIVGFREFKGEVVWELFKMQEESKKSTGTCVPTLVLFDDAVSQQMIQDNAILQLFTRGRHSHISVVYSTQDPTLMSTKWRANVDVIICCKQKNPGRRDIVIKSLLCGNVGEELIGRQKEQHFWIQLLRQVTKNYRVLVVDVRKEEELESVCWYRAP